MAVRTKEELLNDIKSIIGDSTDDTSIILLEDISDTFDDLESRSTDTEDWKTKYEENDAEWRRKYTDRFFSAEPDDAPDPDPADPGEEKEPMTFEDLFTEAYGSDSLQYLQKEYSLSLNKGRNASLAADTQHTLGFRISYKDLDIVFSHEIVIA